MALGQAARTLQAGKGLKKSKLSNTATLRAAMSLAQGNAMAEAMLRANSFAMEAGGDQRNMNALLAMYGSKGHMSAANINPTGQIMRNAGINQSAMDAKAARKAKGLKGRLKRGKGRPVEGPGSPGWQGKGQEVEGGGNGGAGDGGDLDAGGGWGGDPSGGFLV
jgi:hypothetical protein